MPPGSALTELQQRILLTLWKMNGVGKNHITEDTLKADPTLVSSGDLLTNEIANLQIAGFLEMASANDHNTVSLTPLGLAILRQIEEDRLQELR
jgi:hypothetical protein